MVIGGQDMDLDELKEAIINGDVLFPEESRSYTFEDTDHYNAAFDGIIKDWEVIEEGEWEGEKYMVKTNLVRHKDTGAFYHLSQSRSGSYFTDWEYDFPDLDVTEVRPIIVEVIEWH